MTKTREEVAELRARVEKVRKGFDERPEIKWLPSFKNANPDLNFETVRNVYYLKSTDREITERLEKHLSKYVDLIEGGDNG